MYRQSVQDSSQNVMPALEQKQRRQDKERRDRVCVTSRRNDNRQRIVQPQKGAQARFGGRVLLLSQNVPYQQRDENVDEGEENFAKVWVHVDVGRENLR